MFSQSIPILTPSTCTPRNIPLRSNIADIVIANATLHHCDDMQQALSEAARLVKPGGLLITDLDPQIIAWQLKGLGHLLHQTKYTHLFPLYRYLKGRPLASWTMQKSSKANGAKLPPSSAPPKSSQDSTPTPSHPPNPSSA
ncbi:MAG: class I SAM-dependent methyltransferase [Alkalinema sp. RU_4_3]|nr:class I SAM-dependent methyltransferase [Alkalinema sp. RU_4_3]